MRLVSTKSRKHRKWRQVERIVGAGVYKLPESFRNGLYTLIRAKLPDSEIVLAHQRCLAWLARAKKDGYGQCECGCAARFPVEAKNARGQSVWCLDHDDRTKTFRGVLHSKCNRQVGSGNKERKRCHLNYVENHEARVERKQPSFLERTK